MTHAPTLLSRSTSFLWKDYEPSSCFWEVVELLRKISLTGFVLFIPSTRIVQRTLVGFLISIVYTTVLLKVGPYKEPIEDKVAVASGLISSVMLVSTLLMKLCDKSDDSIPIGVSNLGRADQALICHSHVRADTLGQSARRLASPTRTRSRWSFWWRRWPS